MAIQQNLQELPSGDLIDPAMLAASQDQAGSIDMAKPVEMLGLALYGKYWKSPLARALNISNMTIDAWMALPEDKQRTKLGAKAIALAVERRLQLMRFLQVMRNQQDHQE